MKVQVKFALCSSERGIAALAGSAQALACGGELGRFRLRQIRQKVVTAW